MGNFAANATPIFATLLVAGVFMIVWYQAKIRAGAGGVIVLTKFVVSLAMALASAWLLFAGGMAHYIAACVCSVILARTIYLWAKNPARDS